MCIETMQVCRMDRDQPFEGDLRTHLQFMYDRCESKGRADDNFFRDYALNRMLAPWRDNERKRAGKQASRTVKSRNETAQRLTANRCEQRRGILRCMRPPQHDGPCKF